MSAGAARKPPSTALVLLGAIGGPLLFVGLFVWMMSGFAAYEAVASGFVREVAAGRYEAAYGRMASPYRASVPLERFRASLSHNAWFRGATSVDISRTVSNHGGTSASGTMLRPGGEVGVRFHFVEEGDVERITNVVIGGANAVPSPAEAP